MTARGPGERRREVRWRIWQQLPLLVALVLLWMLLWGEVSALSIVSGLVVALATSLLFYLPPVELSGRFQPLWFAWFLLVLAGEVVVASVQVAARAVGPRVRANAVIAVPLHTDSDFVMSATAIVVSVVPGSIVLEVDRDSRILYLHVIAATERSIARARAEVLRSERLLVRAIGSRADLERIALERSDP